MQDVLLAIHLILALGIIGLVMIQRSEGGGLGIGGGGGGLGGVASARGTANLLTRLTAIFAAGFFCTSLALGVLADKSSTADQSILDVTDNPAPVISNIINEDDLKSPEQELEKENATTEPSAPLAPLEK